MSDVAKYAELFDYLSAPTLPLSAEPAIVFGRNDKLVAHKLVDLVVPDLVETVVITGGIGKDTGDLRSRGYRSEAHFLQDEAGLSAAARGVTLPQVVLDEKAANGGENARNGLAILLGDETVELDALTTVLHATSARRLSETVKYEAGELGLELKVFVAPSNYTFNPSLVKDQDEAANELLRLADWPDKGLLGVQSDLPEDLVDFIRSRHGKSPNRITPLQSNILKIMPKGLRQRVINIAANHGRK